MENLEDIVIILNEILLKVNKIDKKQDKIENNMKEFKNFYFEDLNNRIEEAKNIEENNHKSMPLTSFTEYDRILLNNLESRLCILEEESQNYNVK